MRLPASGGTAGGAHPHPLETCLSGVDGSSSVFEDDEELTLLPAAGGGCSGEIGDGCPCPARSLSPPAAQCPARPNLLLLLPPPNRPSTSGRSHGAHTHKRSFSFQVQNQMQTFQVALQFKPAADVAALAAGHAGSGGGRGSGRSSCSTQEDEPFLSLHDLQPSKRTSEWVSVGITLLPKISWVRCGCCAALWVLRCDAGAMMQVLGPSGTARGGGANPSPSTSPLPLPRPRRGGCLSASHFWASPLPSVYFSSSRSSQSTPLPFCTVCTCTRTRAAP